MTMQSRHGPGRVPAIVRGARRHHRIATRTLVVSAIAATVAALILGGVAGALLFGHNAPPAGRLVLGLDAGYDARDNPVIVDPRSTFASGDSLAFVIARPGGAVFGTDQLTMIVRSNGTTGGGKVLRAAYIHAQPQWHGHSYRLNPIDALLGRCQGVHFTLQIDVGAARLASAPFDYTGCAHPTSSLRGHVDLGRSATYGADRRTVFVKQPTDHFSHGQTLAVVIVTSVSIGTQNAAMVVGQRLADGQFDAIDEETVLLTERTPATSLELAAAPIERVLAECHPSGSTTYRLDLRLATGLTMSGTFTYDGCTGTVPTSGGG